jgi:hypothetical protein
MRRDIISNDRKSGTAGRILAVLLASTLALSTLSAAPKTNGGRNKGTTPSGQCSVAPNPTLNGQQNFTVSGSGFTGGITLDILVGGGMFLFAATDSSGNFSTSAWAAFSQTGTQEVKIYRMGDKRETVLATCSFVVQ